MITAGASRVASGPLDVHAVATTPAGPMEPVRSYRPTVIALPRIQGGSAPASAFSRPAQRLLTLRPARSPSRLATLLHRRLQQLPYLHRCLGCYRAERTSSRAGLSPAVDQRLSRRTRIHRLRPKAWTTTPIAAPGSKAAGIPQTSESSKRGALKNESLHRPGRSRPAGLWRALRRCRRKLLDRTSQTPWR